MSTELVNTNPFGDMTALKAETPSGLALQTAAMAEVMAGFQFAKMFPRNEMAAYNKIIQACGRDALAEKAVYSYPRGGEAISGPSIHLARTLKLAWGNIHAGIKEVSQKDGATHMVAFALDLETNTSEIKEFVVKHQRDTRGGPVKLTSDRDIYEMGANMGARRERACILAVIPPDVIEAAVAACEATLKAKINITPELIENMTKAFAAYGITKQMIVKRLGRPIDKISEGNVLQLKGILNSLKDGMSTPDQHFDTTAEVQQEGATIKEKLNAKVAAQQQKTEPAQEPDQRPAQEVVHVCAAPDCGIIVSEKQANDSTRVFGKILCDAHIA